jgi:hypothetical protein
MIDYTLILSTNYVGKQWTLIGYEYEGLKWLDESPKPTKAELDALWESTQAQYEAKVQAPIVAKQSALNKLMALGLTEEEALALGAK